MDRGGSVIYLASPYSDPDPAIREARYQAVCKYAAKLMSEGLNVFSPIAHCHGIAKYGLPTDWEYWQSVDREWIGMSNRLVVLMLPGWLESKGVNAETLLARDMGLDVEFVDEVQ